MQEKISKGTVVEDQKQSFVAIKVGRIDLNVYSVGDGSRTLKVTSTQKTSLKNVRNRGVTKRQTTCERTLALKSVKDG